MSKRVLVYILAVPLAFAVAAGVGVMATLIMQDDLSLPVSEKLQPSEGQGNAQQSESQSNAQQSESQSNAQQSESQSNAQQSEADYMSKVGKLQSESVKTFLDSHNQLLRYDALTADDVDKMENNQDTLGELADQADNFKPPQKYRQQHETFNSAISELHEASQLAYKMASDPTDATQPRFDEYDRHVNEAAANLRRSNEILGRDYKTIGSVQRVNTLS
jgi:hypothetical protein